MVTFDLLMDYVNHGRIKLNKHPTDDLYLFCYTASEFYKFEWDDVTKAARGLVFNGKKERVNCPLPKIFNIDEVEETKAESIEQRLATMEYDVYHKANGHLAIVFWYDGKWYNTTKGSWDMEFIPKDRELLEPVFKHLDSIDRAKEYTYMFEIIADYDKHTNYKHEVERYSDNVPVLLCAYHNQTQEEMSYSQLVDIAVGCSELNIVDKFDCHSMPKVINEWYDQKDTEGYVVTFYDGQKVKIKTKEYLFLRYVKDFESGNKMRNLFIDSFNRGNPELMYENVPEEYHYKVREILNEFYFSTERIRDDYRNVLYEMSLYRDIISNRKDQYLWLKENVSDDILWFFLRLLDGKPIENSKPHRDWFVKNYSHVFNFKEGEIN